jgi:hypothetical protein
MATASHPAAFSAAAPPTATPPLATLSQAPRRHIHTLNQFATSVAATMSGSLSVFAAAKGEPASKPGGSPRAAPPAATDAAASLSGSSQRGAAASPFSGHQLVASKKLVSS